MGPDHHTPPKAAEKKSKANQTKYLVCEETILEPDEKTDGHNTVFCKGDCQGWMHRQCAGLSRLNFDKLGESTMPYLCTYCTLNKQYKEICTLKDTVQTLTNRITELEAACKSSVSKPTAAQVTQIESSVNSTSVINKHSTAFTASLPPSIDTSERKFNIVVYGIAENRPKTNKETRVKEDLNNLLTYFIPRN